MEQATVETTLEGAEKNVEHDKFNEFTKGRILKNLVVVSLTFLISFTASEGLAFLQSTMNKDVGVISFAVQYSCGCVASLFLPKYLIQKFGSKLVLVASMFAYVPYLSSNFYPVFGFMIPTSILVGFASSLVFNSLCTYLNDLSFIYTKICVGNDVKDVDSNPSPNEKEILKNKLKASPQFYNSLRKHKDSIFITKQSLLGERDVFSTVEGTIDKEIALIQFKTGSPLNKRFSKENTEKNNLTEEDLKKQEKPDVLNYKIQDIFKKRYDINKNKTEQHTAETEDNSNISVLAVNNESKCSGNKKPFESRISCLGSVPEGSQESSPQNGIKSTTIVEDEQKDSFDKTVTPPDKATKVLETITSRFFGFFGFVYQMCHILCNVISYFIFQSNSVEREYTRNSTCVCGSDFCSMESACVLHNLQVPSTETRYTLTTVYVVMSFIAALLALLFLDNLIQKNSEATFSLEMAVMTFKHHRNKNQLLIIPLSLYLGMTQAFVTGDFTKDFIGCAWGVEHVSLVLISFGCAISLSSGLYALLEKYVGRYLFFSGAAALNLAVIVTMLCWTPDPNQSSMMFVVAFMWGAILGTMWCQLRAFIGLIFKEEEETAFGCYQLWHAVGCAVVYAYNNYICTFLKIYILLIISTVAVVGYLLAERNYTLSKKQCNKT